MSERHTAPRYSIGFKRYTHEILKHEAQSGRKFQMKVILAHAIELLAEHKLVTSRGGFLLSRREAVFVEERASSQAEGWNTIRVDQAEVAEILQAFSDTSGIDKAQIVDHMVRLVRDLKIISGDGKGQNRLIEAIENRHEVIPMDVALVELPENRNGELYPTHTHSITCLKGRGALAHGEFYDCPLDGSTKSLEDSCLSECDHLRIEVKRNFKIPEECEISYALLLRLGYGRSETTVTNEALDRGWAVYEKQIGHR